jgi:6-phosphofructokinase 2
MVKPSKRELEHLIGRKAATPEEEEALAREVVTSGRAEVVALTLGAAGAVLVTKDQTIRLASPQVEARSAVGAGDSFVGAMIWALAAGHSLADAFAHGVAAGAASAMTTGTELCRRADVETLFAEVGRPPLPAR